VSDEKLWDESPTSRHLQVLYHQTSFQVTHADFKGQTFLVTRPIAFLTTSNMKYHPF